MQAKSVLASKTLWINLLILILGSINQEFLVSVGATAQVQIIVLTLVNMVLRLFTEKPVAINP